MMCASVGLTKLVPAPAETRRARPYYSIRGAFRFGGSAKPTYQVYTHEICTLSVSMKAFI
jgi:hypothetical protein